MFYVYVILSETHNSRYIGYTENLERRLKEHNSGGHKYTSGRRPWKLIHFESFPTKSEAMKRELFLKSGVGRKYLDTLFAEEWQSG